jgi:hypothetical protein
MEISGKIKKINETQTVGVSSFQKRELVVVTNEQYPQMLLIEFIQDKCDLLNNYNFDDEVTVSINLRGREWINSDGQAKYFNTFQGWKITDKNESKKPPPLPSTISIENDLPF